MPDKLSPDKTSLTPVPPRVYLDYLATCPLLEEVRESMLPYLADRFGHPGSLHQEGHTARNAIKRAREQFAALVNAESLESILFTGTPTEAINLAIKGAALALPRIGNHLVTTTAEQPAVAQSIDWLESQGFSVTRVPVDAEGRINPAAIQAALREDTILVCTHHANLDIGTIQLAAEIGEITASRGIVFFVDATASAGWIPVDVQAMKADLAALAPHRFHGSKGVGVLYKHRRARVQPLLHGIELDSSENVAGVVGAGTAAEIASRELPLRQEHGRALQQLFWRELVRLVPHLTLNGPSPGPDRLPHSLNLSIEFVEGEGLALMLDVRGVALASGAACVTKTMRVPPVLAAIRLPEALARGNVIVSFARATTESEVRFAVETFARAVATLREMSPLWDDFQNGRINSELRNVERGIS